MSFIPHSSFKNEKSFENVLFYCQSFLMSQAVNCILNTIIGKVFYLSLN